jgi:CheY-like chemotaxis protein/HPt (histidine-containing phosphotransfer) domain-containing protein
LAAELNPAVVLLDAPEHTHGDQHSEADRSSLGWGDHIRQLWVGRYQHGPVRILSPRVGHLGRAHVQDVIRGVAVLAGRRSPDLVRNELKDFEALSAEIGSAEHQQSANSYLILIAEDDSTNQKVVKRQLQILGYTCEIADDGLAALAQWRTGRFDLLLSDLHMPEMDGYELAQQIRAEEAAHHFNRVPILALTANALAGEQARAQACGMDDYLTKPIELKALHHALKRWLPVASNLAQDFERGEALPETPPPANAHINVDTLRQLVGDDDDIVHELLLDFVTSSRALGESFALAASTHAMEQVKQIAHKLKSAARSVGAHALGQICESMESSADTGDDSSKLIGELLQELKQVHLAIDNLIQEPVQ